ncbi:MAG: DNA repair protein RecN [Bacteroidetes bacterium]|nr:DNA repair protein RecN [Bacteroidota bacterium]MCL5737245.1 DNA repair protein RecN [Bacteroidota bacterium]
MLKTLSIKNFALIEELEIEFGTGLNIITGETGAGKSIIIDALSLILGERASADDVRSGAEKAVVEGIFTISGNRKVKSMLADALTEMDEEIIVRREVNQKGQTRAFVNDTPIPIAQMKTLGDLLVDLHGQHEHQSLLRAETHIDLLDDFGGLDALLNSFRDVYQELSGLISQLKELVSKRDALQEKRDLYLFQIKEIDAVAPQTDEMDKLEAELKILENSEKLYEATNKLYELLYESESSVHDQLVIVRNQLEDLAGIDRSFDNLKEECESARAIVDEITRFLQSYSSRIDFNPQRLDEIRDRLGALSMLQKKYGGSIDSVISYREKIGKDFALAENFDEEIAKLELSVAETRAKLSDIAERLSSKRREVAERVSRSIFNVLAEIGIEKAKFEVNVENRTYTAGVAALKPLVKLGTDYYETNEKGFDFVEFFISTNVGEEPKPLVKVASGGEISRIMLALKTILAKSDRLPVLVFDEIDTGISGRVAAKVARALKSLSSFHQIVAITHLPQIAGKADLHFLVEKVVKGKRAVTQVSQLSEDERVKEVARLLSGDDITKASISGAKEMIGIK